MTTNIRGTIHIPTIKQLQDLHITMTKIHNLMGNSHIWAFDIERILTSTNKSLGKQQAPDVMD
jgi:hypothetical protein